MKPATRFLVVLLILPATLAGQVPGQPPMASSAVAPVPNEHGLFFETRDGWVAIVGQAVSSAHAGSPLSAAATFGLKSMKLNVVIPGRRAANTTGASPVFYYRPPWETETVGGSAGDLVLVRMSVKHGSRQVQVGAVGAFGANAGISTRAQVQLVRKQIAPGLYALSPAEPLKPGEYGFYLHRGYDLPGYIYDFSVK